MKFIWPLLYAVTLALIFIRPARADPPTVFDAPVTIRLNGSTPYALIIDATDTKAAGAWIQYKVKCYGSPGPCEFAGQEVAVFEPDGTQRVGDVPRFNYSPHSDAWEAYGWHGCIDWNQQGLHYYCGPNGETITTKLGNLDLQPWRDLRLYANNCYYNDACPFGAYGVFAEGVKIP